MGPTASGKSNWGFQKALESNAAIINCDSVQVYKYLDIGSAKPAQEEMKSVPHYLYDYIDYPQVMTAGMYVRDFFKVIESIENDHIFVIGGTGFYFQALEKGMYPVRSVDVEFKEIVQKEILNLGFDEVYSWIQERDPEYAEKISKNDKYRIERAYELMRFENKSITEIQNEFLEKQKPFPYEYRKVGFTHPKEEFFRRVSLRTEQMLKDGLIREVFELIKSGKSNWDPLMSVGYKEVLNYLNQFCKRTEGGLEFIADNMPLIPEQDLEPLKNEIIQNTMRLIKKQKTWFQRDKNIQWISAADSR